MVSEHDKRIFRLIGEAKNPPIVKMTREEKLRNFKGKAYLQFLSDFTPLVHSIRINKNLDPIMEESTAHLFYEKAKKLGLLELHK